MLSISAMKSGQGEYYASLAQEDYYFEGGEPEGVWLGKGAEVLGLNGKVSKQDLKNLFQGFSPDGKTAIVQNAGHENRQAGWDLTFSASKSVSYAWSQVPEWRTIIQEEHFKALTKGIAYLEENTITRRGHSGVDREQAGLVVATFEHGTSRLQDMQLHTHCLVMNVAVRSDNSTGAIESWQFYTHKMAAGALYRAELAHGLQQRLGLEIERKSSWFELKGVPESVIEQFSKRRHDIEERLKEKGFSTAKAAEIAALDTRTVKGHKARSELFEDWQHQGKAIGFSRAELLALAGKAQTQDVILHIQEIVNTVSETITQNNSHFGEKEVVRLIAEAAPGRGIDSDLVREIARGYLRSEEVVALQAVKHEKRYTTVEFLSTEERMLNQVLSLKDTASHPVQDSTIDAVLLTERFLTIKPEQKNALLHITKTPGSVQIVSGMAGTGKTYMLAAAKRIYEAEGYEVKGIALAGKAAQGLTEGAGIESSTIAKFLNDLQTGELSLSSKTVVICDEAGMVSTQKLATIVDAIAMAGAKLVLVGDAKQLQPIEAGGAFRVLGEKLGEAELREITRQLEAWAREAVHHFAAGNAEAALTAYAEQGLVHISTHRTGAINKILNHWRAGGGTQSPEEHLILASTRKDVEMLNRRAQALRLKEGKVQAAEHIPIHHSRCFTGDRILFTRNSILYGVRNGTFGTVLKIDAQSRKLIVMLDTGERTTIKLKNHPLHRSGYDKDSIVLGYASTTHKAQGMTVKNAYILTDEAIQNREITYVQMSRAKVKTQIYTTNQEAGEDLSEMKKRMDKSRQKQMALEIV